MDNLILSFNVVLPIFLCILLGYFLRRIRMVDNPPRMDLEQSTRYLEGLRSRDAFADFRDWALLSRPEDMLAQINRPITPNFGQVVDG